MRFINVTTVAEGTPLAPFDGWLLSDVVVENHHEALCQSFPDRGFAILDVRPSSPASEYLGGSLEVLPLVSPAAEFADPWKGMIAEIQSADYDRAIEGLVGQSLQQTTKRLRLMRYTRGAYLDTHFDNQRNKILTQIFYFNRSWNQEWGGCLELLLGPPASNPNVLKVLPVISNSPIIQSTEKAFHRVSRICAENAPTRNTMLVEWFRNGS